jgi:hypothetical protein
MFHLFQTYVVSVSFGCSKTRSGCCIYMQVFSGVFIHMLQVFHLDVRICLQWLYTCFQVFFVFCKCFRHMLQVFQLFRTYVTSVSLGCCKSRSGVAHVTMHMRRGEDASGPACVQSGGVGVVRATRAPCGRAKCRLRRGRAGPSAGNGVQRERPSRCPNASTAVSAGVGVYPLSCIALSRKHIDV